MLSVLSFVFSAFALLFAVQHARERERVQSWRVTPGVITKVIDEVHTDSDDGEHHHYSVRFSYVLDGVTYTAGENTPGSRPYNAGDRVRVRYSGRTPWEVRLDEEVERKVSYHMTFGIVMATFGAIFAVLALATRRKLARPPDL